MTLLAIFAHPDDEAFGTGGALTRYAAEGKTVKLICATRGESGKITDPDIDSASDVAELREGELREACKAMGLDAPVFLDFHDSGRQERTRYDDPKALMNVNEEDLEQALLPHIREVQPDIILTFDPHGVYGHIDHIKIHRAATAAFWSAGKVMNPAPKRLFYSVMASERMKQMQAMREDSPLSKLDPEMYGVLRGFVRRYLRHIGVPRAERGGGEGAPLTGGAVIVVLGNVGRARARGLGGDVHPRDVHAGRSARRVS